MPVTDQIGDFLTRIRNAGAAGKKTCEAPRSNIKVSIAKILKEQGYIEDYFDQKDDVQGTIKVQLKYFERKPVIHNVSRVSTPGRRWYVASDNLTKVKSGLGVAIVSTSKGLMTVKDCKKHNVGGEVICTVW